MKYISKLLSGLVILAILGMSTASAGITNRNTNILAHGDFENGGTAEWVANTAILSNETGTADVVGSKVLRVTRDGGSYGSATIAIINGATYTVDVWGRGDGTNSGVVYVGGVACSAITNSVTWQHVRCTATAGSAIFRLTSNGTDGGYTEWDNVSITRYYGTVQNRDTNLLSNGNFENGVTNWTTLTGTLSAQTGAGDTTGTGILRIAWLSDPNPFATQTPSTVTGALYRIRGQARGDGTHAPRVQYTSTPLWTGTSSTDWQPFDITAVSTGLSTQIVLRAVTSSAGYAEFDNISFTRYYGTTKNVERNLLLDGNQELVGVTNYSTVGGTLSKEAGASDYQGSQVLRVTWASGSTAYATPLSLPIASGQTYHFQGWARGDGNVPPTLDWASSAYISKLWTGTTSTSWQRIDVVATAPATALYTRWYASGANGAGEYVEFDNMSITAYNREANYISDSDMEIATTAAWNGAGLGTPITTKESGAYSGVGSLILKIAYNANSNPAVKQDNIFTQNATYRVKGCVAGDGVAGRPYVTIGNAQTIFSGTLSSTPQCFDTTIISTSTQSEVRLYCMECATGAHFTTYDNISVTRLY